MLNFKDFMDGPEQSTDTAQNVVQMTPQDSLFVQIEGFTKDDFNKDDPYLFILKSHNGDEVLYTRLKNKLFDQAKLVKYPVSDVKTQIKSIENSNRNLLPKAGQANVTGNGFPGIDQFFGNAEVQYGSYTCSAEGIIGSTLQGVPVKICRHPLFVSKRYINILTEQESVDITFFQQGRWKTIRQVPRSEVASAQKIVKILAARGVNITSESAKGIVTFLSDFDDMNREIIPSSKATDVIGWMPDGSFVPYDGNIAVDAMSSDLDVASMASSLHAEGDPELWLNAVRDLRKKKVSKDLRMYMAASFASVLVEPLKRLPFLVHMHGKRDTGKSVSLRIAATIWGKAELNDGWMRTLNGTNVGFETWAGFARHLPLCLNELQVAQRADSGFADIVYMLCEGNAKIRGNRNGGLRKARSWRLITLTCGEEQIVTSEDRGGANIRVIEIVVEENLYDDPQKLCMNVLDKSYGHAGKMFIDGFKQEDQTALEAEWLASSKQMADAGKARKQADAGALLLLADRLAEKYVFKDGVRLSMDDVLGYLKDEAQTDDDLNALFTIKGLIAENNINFISPTNRDPRVLWGRFIGKDLKDKNIDSSGNSVAFRKSAFDELARAHNIDPMRFIRWCVKHGYVEDHRTEKYKNIDYPVRLCPNTPQAKCFLFHFPEEEDPAVDQQTGATIVANNDPVQTEIPF